MIARSRAVRKYPSVSNGLWMVRSPDRWRLPGILEVNEDEQPQIHESSIKVGTSASAQGHLLLTAGNLRAVNLVIHAAAAAALLGAAAGEVDQTVEERGARHAVHGNRHWAEAGPDIG